MFIFVFAQFLFVNILYGIDVRVPFLCFLIFLHKKNLFAENIQHVLGINVPFVVTRG
jgi:hypothetical protein